MSETAKNQRQSEAELLASVVIAERCTISTAADSIGWSESKAYKISCTDSYRKCYATRLIELADANVQQSIDAETKAISTLIRLMDSEAADVAVSAAKGILSHNAKSVATLERQLSVIRNREAYARSSVLDGTVDYLIASRRPSN